MSARKPYDKTKVHWSRSQAEICRLLAAHGIQDVRFTTVGSQQTLVLEFSRVETIDDQEVRPAVRIVVPGLTDEAESSRLHRVLYWYLKAKLESLDHGLVEFWREFMPFLVVPGPGGRSVTLAEIVGPQYQRGLLTGDVQDLELLPSWAGDSRG